MRVFYRNRRMRNLQGAEEMLGPSDGGEFGKQERNECMHLRDAATCKDCAKSRRIGAIKASMWLAAACAVVFAALLFLTW